MESDVKHYTLKDFNIDSSSLSCLTLVSDDGFFKLEVATNWENEIYFNVYRLHKRKGTWSDFDDYRWDIKDSDGHNFYYDNMHLERALLFLNTSLDYEQTWKIKFSDMTPKIVRDKDILFVTKCKEYGIFQRFVKNHVSYTPVSIKKTNDDIKYTIIDGAFDTVDQAIDVISDEIKKIKG